MNIFNHSVKEFFLSRLACEESLHQKCVLNSLFFLKMKSNTDRNSDGFFPIHVLVPENYLNAETACLLANQCRAPVSPIPPFKQRIHFVPAHGYPPHDSVCTSSSMGQVWSAAHLTQGGDSDGQMLPTGFEVKAEQVFFMSQTRWRSDATLQSTGSGNLDTLLYCLSWSSRSHLNPRFLSTNLCGLFLPPVPSVGPAELFGHFRLEP